MLTNLSTAALIHTQPSGSVNSVGTARQNLPDQGTSVPPAANPPPIQQEELVQALQVINSYVQNLRRDLEFTIDDQTDRTIIRVIDSETKEVIRQIPSEAALAISRSLEQPQGLLLDTQT